MKGIVQKIGTQPDGTVRFSVDVPTELAPNDLKAWLYEYVVVERQSAVVGRQPQEEGRSCGSVKKQTRAKGMTHGKKEERAGGSGKKQKARRRS